MRGKTFLLSAVSLFCMLAVTAEAHTVITRMSDKEQVSLPQLAQSLEASDVVLVGESHDAEHHHELQLDLISAIFEADKRLAIGLEMMQSDYQEQLDKWVAGNISEAVMQAFFELNWSDWPLYRDIFVFARDNEIPMVALNVPAHIVRKVSMHGFRSLTAEERGDLPAGISCDLKNPQIAFLRKAFLAVANHGQNGRIFGNFCEAQTVRNSGMALNALHYLEKNPDRSLVVLTGIWHAVKYAIPDQLQRLGEKMSYTVILPETPHMNSRNAGTDEADYMVEQ